MYPFSSFPFSQRIDKSAFEKRVGSYMMLYALIVLFLWIVIITIHYVWGAFKTLNSNNNDEARNGNMDSTWIVDHGHIEAQQHYML